MRLVILKKEIKIIVFGTITLCLYSCSTNTTSENIKEQYLNKSQNVVGKENYFKIYQLLTDSLNSWKINKIGYHKFCGESKNCFIDTLMCFNKDGNKFIGAKLMQQLLKDGVADDIDFLLGAKIENKWYFLQGANVFIPREMFKNHPINLPLSYQQLHEMALQNVYKGYLNADGSINDAMINYYFPKNESDFKTKKEYERYYLALSKNIWLERYFPYGSADFKTSYDAVTKELHVSFPLKTFDSINCPPIKYKLLYEYEGLGYIGNIFINNFSAELNWYKSPVINAVIKDIPANKEIKLYLEVLHYPDAVSPRYGPFVTSTNTEERRVLN